MAEIGNCPNITNPPYDVPLRNIFAGGGRMPILAFPDGVGPEGSGMFDGLISYLDSIKARDPAPRSRWEIMLYPGVLALGLHRVAHWLFQAELYFLARLINHFARMITAIDRLTAKSPAMSVILLIMAVSTAAAFSLAEITSFSVGMRETMPRV